MYLFILESIGISELILIGIVALIIFGPRKLPQMAKTFGKTMADFKRTTNEFKETWEREASVLDELKLDEDDIKTIRPIDNSVSRKSLPAENENDELTPKIREIQAEEIDENLLPKPERAEANINNKTEVTKHDWL